MRSLSFWIFFVLVVGVVFFFLGPVASDEPSLHGERSLLDGPPEKHPNPPQSPEIGDSGSEESDTHRRSSVANEASGELLAIASDSNKVTIVRVVRGRLVTNRKTPVSGATVRSISTDTAALGDIDGLIAGGRTFSKVGTTVTNQEGSFVIVNPTSGKFILEASAPGFIPMNHSVFVPTSGPEIDLGDLELSWGVRLQGVVQDERGAPVEGAKLTWIRDTPEPPLGGVARFSKPDIGRTDPAGAFATQAISAGPWTVEVSADGFVSKSFSGDSNHEATTGLVFQLDRGLFFHGRVVAGSPPSPSPLRVELITTTTQRKAHEVLRRPWNEVEFASAACDSKNEFRLGPIPASLSGETFELSVTHWGDPLSLLEPVRARPGETDLVLELEAPFLVQFEAVDARTGASLEKAEVRLSRWLLEQDHPLGNVTAVCDVQADGRWTARVKVSSQFRQSLRVRPLGYESYESAMLQPVVGGQQNLGRLLFEPQLTERVEVLDESTGVPVAGAQVQAVDAIGLSDPKATHKPRPGPQGGVFRTIVEDWARTDEQGLARVTRAPSREAFLIVRHRAFATCAPLPLQAAPSEAPRRVLLSSGATLVVTISRAGKPVADAYVERIVDGLESRELELLRLAGDPIHLSGQTDEAGQVRFDCLALGHYRFRVKSVESAVFDVHLDQPQMQTLSVTL